MSLRVALDARELPLGPSGDRTYLLSLLREYAMLAPDHRFLLCYQHPGATGLEGPPAPNMDLHVLPMRPGWLWTPLAWPRLLRRERADVAHAQHLIPPLAPCPTIVTIHDVSFLRHPEWFPPRQVRIMRRLIPLSARRATRIITGSHHAAGEIAALCRVRPEKITVIYDGVGPAYTPGDRTEARRHVAERHGLAGPYVLAVGLIQPRKNLPRLLTAFALLAPDFPDLKLAIVGRVGWEAEAVDRRIADLRLADRVVKCGAVADADLPDLYRAAALLAYPSLYEGFGLPPLEAMACGTPVVASNTTSLPEVVGSTPTSLPEVVGEAGLLVDPLEPAAMAAAMRRILADPALAEDLGQRGAARATQFTWSRSAAAHLGVYAALARREQGGTNPVT